MKTTIQNFIGIFEDAYSKEYCEQLIKDYDTAIKAGYGLTRQDNETVSKIQKTDTQLFNPYNNIQIPLENVKLFNDIFWGECYSIYAKEIAILQDLGKHSNYHFKMQKTGLKEGYHIWHCEAGNRNHSLRVLFWILYLNDVEEGGETEFLYQSMRVKPKAGTLVIAPSSFTHTQRGNPPLSNEKYIVTGWTEF